MPLKDELISIFQSTVSQWHFYQGTFRLIIWKVALIQFFFNPLFSWNQGVELHAEDIRDIAGGIPSETRVINDPGSPAHNFPLHRIFGLFDGSKPGYADLCQLISRGLSGITVNFLFSEIIGNRSHGSVSWENPLVWSLPPLQDNLIRQLCTLKLISVQGKIFDNALSTNTLPIAACLMWSPIPNARASHLLRS